jgi:5-methylcytosine-specific restriction endonuclease McrA
MKERDSNRGSAVERQYDWRWHKCRDAYLRRHPLCVVCGKPARMVDHIVPLSQGGAMLDEDNWQSMCWKDHGIKSAKDKAAGGGLQSLEPDRS